MKNLFITCLPGGSKIYRMERKKSKPCLQEGRGEIGNPSSPCSSFFPCILFLAMVGRAPKKNTSHGNEVLPQNTTHHIQRPCYQRGSLCKDSAGNRTTRKPGHHKETQIAVVWSCLPFIKSGQNHLARHSERGKKARQIEEEGGRPHQALDKPGICQVPEGSGEQGQMGETGCEIICGAPTPLAVKG